MKIFALLLVIALSGCVKNQEIKQVDNWNILSEHKVADTRVKKVVISSSGKGILAAAIYQNVSYLPIDDMTPPSTLKFDDEVVGFDEIVGGEGIFLALKEGKFQVWNYSLDKLEFEYKLEDDSAYATLSPSGKYVAYGDVVFDLHSQKIIREGLQHAGQSSLQFSSGNMLYATSFWGESIDVIDLANNNAKQWRTGVKMVCADMDANGKKLVTATRDNKLLIWDVQKELVTEDMPLSGYPRFVSFSADDSWFAVLDDDEVSVFDSESYGKLANAKVRKGGALLANKGPFLFVSDDSGSLVIWSSKLDAFYKLNLGNEQITAIDYDEQNHLIAVGDESGVVKTIRWSVGAF